MNELDEELGMIVSGWKKASSELLKMTEMQESEKLSAVSAKLDGCTGVLETYHMILKYARDRYYENEKRFTDSAEV